MLSLVFEYGLTERRYRFRLINMSCDAPYMFSIDGHNLTVIEVDGVLTEKYTVTHIPILAGEYQVSCR